MFGQPVSSLKEAAAAGGCSDSRRRRHRLRLTLILTVLSVVFVCLFADLSILLLKVERRTPMDGIASCYHYCPLTDWLADIRWCTNEKKNIINNNGATFFSPSPVRLSPLVYSSYAFIVSEKYYL